MRVGPLAILVPFLVLAPGCFADKPDACTAGQEGCACVSGDQCLEGLECRSDVCVGPDTGTGEDEGGSSASGGSASTTGTTGGTGTTSTSGGSTTGAGGSTTTSSSGSEGADEGTTATATSGADETSSGADDSTTGTTSGGEASTGADPICGDGEVNQPDEMCDGGPGCDDNCEFEDYACNPLNQAGCEAGAKCGYANVGETFTCDADFGTGLLGVECYDDFDCTIGYTCLWGGNADACESLANCCVEYCDTRESDTVQCAHPSASCWPFFPEPMGQGLEHLGYCGDP